MSNIIDFCRNHKQLSVVLGPTNIEFRTRVNSSYLERGKSQELRVIFSRKINEVNGSVGLHAYIFLNVVI